MPVDDLELFTDKDKSHMAYGLCVLGTAAAGATFGSMAGGQTLLGAAGGAVVGLFMCSTVERPLKRALFTTGKRMSDSEFRTLYAQVRRSYPNNSKKQVLDMIAASRLAAAKEPARYRC